MNARHRIGQVLTSLASVTGIPLSIILLLIDIHTKIGDSKGVAELCTASGHIDCSVAASSSYSAIGGVPIAAIGLGFYVAVLLVGLISPMLIPLSGEREDRFLPAYVIFGAYTLALLDSIYLGTINFTQLTKICDKCAMLYAMNLVGFIGAGMWAAGDPIQAIRGTFKRFGKIVFSGAALVCLITFVAAVAGAAWQTQKIVATEKANTPPVLVAKPVDDATAAADNDVSKHLHREGAPALGPPDAPVELVEFSDFQCPHCAHFSALVPQLRDKYGQKLRVVFRNFPLNGHPHSRQIAQMALCANEQGRFWDFEKIAFANQRQLQRQYSEQALVALANKAGLNGEEAQDCMRSNFAKKAVQQDLADANALELPGTPSIYFNGQQYQGRLDIESLSTVIDALLEDTNEDTDTDVPTPNP